MSTNPTSTTYRLPSDTAISAGIPFARERTVVSTVLLPRFDDTTAVGKSFDLTESGSGSGRNRP